MTNNQKIYTLHYLNISIPLKAERTSDAIREVVSEMDWISETVKDATIEIRTYTPKASETVATCELKNGKLGKWS